MGKILAMDELVKAFGKGGFSGLEAIAEAQVAQNDKEWIEWRMEPCPHRASNAKYFKPRSACGKCWEAREKEGILAEAGVERPE